MATAHLWARNDGGTRYRQVADWLRQRIATGELTAGEQLPAQRLVAREAGVTLMTLRRALDLLIDEGVLEAKQGVGTFVVAGPGDRLSVLRSYADVMADQGAETITTVLAAGSAPVTPPVGAQLDLPAGRRAWYVDRLRTVDGVPVTWQRSTQVIVPMTARTRRALAHQSIYDLLGEVGCLVATARQEVRARTTPRPVAELLGVEERDPCLAVERLTLDETGRPVLHDEIYTRGDIALLETSAAASVLIVEVDRPVRAGTIALP